MEPCYHDPLAVAWMAKHFGMQFCAVRTDGNLSMPPSYSLWLRDYEFVIMPDSYTENKTILYYIHPASLFLLEPQEGDKDEDGFVFNAKIQAWERECGEDDEGQPMWRAKLPEESHTARRHGLTFIWPLWEEDVNVI